MYTNSTTWAIVSTRILSFFTRQDIVLKIGVYLLYNVTTMASRTPTIKTTPGILKWARETIGYDLSEVAKKQKVSEEQLVEWENGGEISVSKLKDLANRYKRSMGVFFLPDVPVTKAFPVDFRTLDSVKQEELSNEVRLAVRKARRNREYFEEISEILEEPINREIKKFILHFEEDVNEQAKKLRNLINISIEEQLSWEDKGDALKNWINALEDLGLLVFQMSMPLDEEEGGIRAFCLRGDEDQVPVIVLNTKDSPAGRTFSLFHELAHLLLSENDLAKIKRDNTSLRRQHLIIETFANHFSGSFLVPLNNLLNENMAKRFLSDKEDGELLERLATKYRVSARVILRRFYDSGNVTKNFFENKDRELKLSFQEYKKRLKQKAKEKGQSGGPQPYVMALNASGRKLTQRVLSAQESKKISYFDMVRFFDIKQKHIQKIENQFSQAN